MSCGRPAAAVRRRLRADVCLGVGLWKSWQSSINGVRPNLWQVARTPSEVALKMSNPVLVEVMRGALVESRHRGAVAVVDADGRPRLVAGRRRRSRSIRARRSRRCRRCRWSKAARPTATASATEELALACASHGGEPGHVATASAHAGARRARCGGARNAARTGRSTSRRRRRWRAPAAQASALHNNCSGKHAGLSSASPAPSEPIVARYVEPAHPVQREVKAALENLTGATARRGRLRHRRLLGADLGGAARRAGARRSRASAPATGWRP